MNINKTDKKEIQEAKKNNEKFPDFNGRSNLVLTSKKKSKEEEIKVKEKAESESEFFFKNEELKKPLEEKESELNSANQKFMPLSLDQGTYKQINENLTKNINEIKDTSNNIIERNNKEIDDYKSSLNRIEQKLDEYIKESEESRKETDAKLI